MWGLGLLDARFRGHDEYEVDLVTAKIR